MHGLGLGIANEQQDGGLVMVLDPREGGGGKEGGSV